MIELSFGFQHFIFGGKTLTLIGLSLCYNKIKMLKKLKAKSFRHSGRDKTKAVLSLEKQNKPLKLNISYGTTLLNSTKL